MTDEEDFAAFVRTRSDNLQRAAWLLTGDWNAAHDLVQTALATTWRRWPSVQRRDAPEVYVRRVMMTTFLGWRRRRWTTEVPSDELPEPPDPSDIGFVAAQREDVFAAVRALPRQQRAVVVLRFFADLTERETADALGCGVGTVKSYTARALRTLRANPTLTSPMIEEPS